MRLRTERGPFALLCPGFTLEGSRIDTLGTSAVASGPSKAPLTSFSSSVQRGGQVGRAKLGLSSCFHAHGGVHYFRAVRTS